MARSLPSASVSVGDWMPRITLPLTSGRLFDSWDPTTCGHARVYWLGAPSAAIVAPLARSPCSLRDPAACGHRNATGLFGRLFILPARPTGRTGPRVRLEWTACHHRRCRRPCGGSAAAADARCDRSTGDATLRGEPAGRRAGQGAGAAARARGRSRPVPHADRLLAAQGQGLQHGGWAAGQCRQWRRQAPPRRATRRSQAVRPAARLPGAPRRAGDPAGFPYRHHGDRGADHRLLRRRFRRPLRPAPRQHQQLHRASPVRAQPQPQSRRGVRGRRAAFPRIRPRALPAGRGRRAGLLLVAAARGRAGDARTAVRCLHFPVGQRSVLSLLPSILRLLSPARGRGHELALKRFVS